MFPKCPGCDEFLIVNDYYHIGYCAKCGTDWCLIHREHLALNCVGCRADFAAKEVAAHVE